LKYTFEGVENIAPLWPDSITVTPDPSLIVKYFLEKDVFSDDPFTPEIEPAVPFNLGLMIRNEGYGTARSMKITSGQPGNSLTFFITLLNCLSIEIIDNERGLLISFTIIGSQVGLQPASPSLVVTIGDLQPMTTQVVRYSNRC
jgi:hypothetical protein